ncbi:MAG: DUF2608 domain-containing protein [Planctomycetota bacterium]
MRCMGLILLLLLPAQAEETNDFATIAKASHDLISKHGKTKVLLVFDIDNTLLTMDQDLGGDAWFNWQAGLLKTDPKSDLLVARSFGGLLRVQGKLFSLSGMHPPEHRIPDDVRKLQNTGVKVIALTSRGPEFFSATMRVLKENAYDFGRGGRGGTFLPETDGLSEEEIKRFRMDRRRPVMHQSGVYLAAGQHKGAIVRSFWQAAERRYKAILFADDHKKHIDRVRDAFKESKVELRLFRYGRVDTQVRRFNESDKSDVTAKWRKLNEAMKATLGKREPVGAGR